LIKDARSLHDIKEVTTPSSRRSRIPPSRHVSLTGFGSLFWILSAAALLEGLATILEAEVRNPARK